MKNSWRANEAAECCRQRRSKDTDSDKSIPQISKGEKTVIAVQQLPAKLRSSRYLHLEVLQFNFRILKVMIAVVYSRSELLVKSYT